MGKPKRTVKPPEFDQKYFDEIKGKIGARLVDALDTAKHPKAESYALVKEIKKELEAALPEDDEDAKKMLAHPAMKRWWAVCTPLQEALATRKPGEWWAMMQQVFFTDL